MNACKEKIKYFLADFGGTEILNSLRKVFTCKTEKKYRKRIFLLTDGQVGNSEQVFDEISKYCKLNGQNKVFTFGMRSGADRDMVANLANNGNGDNSFVGDNKHHLLK